MTEPYTGQPEPIDAARQARIAALATARTKKGRRHPAQGARIAAAGIGATTMLGLVGVMGYTQHIAATSAPASTPGTQPQVVIVVHPGSDPAVADPSAPSADTAAATRLEARPTVRPATPRTQAPAASTSGSR